MRISLYIAISIITLLSTYSCYGQKHIRYSVSTQNKTFIVQNGDYIKNIAAKLKVPARDIVKANKLPSRFYMAYPGQKLIIPIPVDIRIWGLSKKKKAAGSSSKEAQAGAEDFKILLDSADYSIRESLIDVDQISSDSAEYQSLDRNINILIGYLDSLQKTQLQSAYDENDVNSVLERMRLARASYYSRNQITSQIDSLQALRASLEKKHALLNEQMIQYQYLADNAPYYKQNFKREVEERNSDWGAHLAHNTESGKKAEPVPANNDLAPVQIDDSLFGNAAAEEDSAIVRRWSDFAELPLQKNIFEIKCMTPYQPSLILLNGETVSTK